MIAFFCMSQNTCTPQEHYIRKIVFKNVGFFFAQILEDSRNKFHQVSCLAFNKFFSRVQIIRKNTHMHEPYESFDYALCGNNFFITLHLPDKVGYSKKWLLLKH